MPIALSSTDGQLIATNYQNVRVNWQIKEMHKKTVYDTQSNQPMCVIGVCMLIFLFD